MNHPFFGQALHAVLDRMQHCLKYDIAIRPEHFERDFTDLVRGFARNVPRNVKLRFSDAHTAIMCGYWKDIYTLATSGDAYQIYPRLNAFDYDLAVTAGGVTKVVEIVSYTGAVRKASGYFHNGIGRAHKHLLMGRNDLHQAFGPKLDLQILAFQNDMTQRHEPVWVAVDPLDA